MSAARGCLVTGTGTGVGKTVVAAAVVATLRARGQSVAAFKPVVTGLDEPPEPGWPPDHELLAAVAGMSPEAVAPLCFGPAVSPHLAAELAHATIDPLTLVAAAQRAGEGCDTLVVEGVGGVLVPLTRSYSARDLARELALPVVVAAAPSLGTINHTLLTLEAIRSASLEVLGVVLTPWPTNPGAIEHSNAETIAELGAVEVAMLARLARPEPRELVRAGSALPLERWLGAPAG